MVCYGNICRSPLAEGILQHKADAAGLHWQVDSAGVSGMQRGNPPHELSQKIALLNGVDICRQSSRSFTKEDMHLYDKIYVMDSENYADVKHIARQFWDATKVEYLLNESFPATNKSIPDPWYGIEADYHTVYAMIDEACTAIIKRYTTQHTS